MSSSRKRLAAAVDHGVSNKEVQPWHRLGGIEHICELRKNSSVLYSILVTILRTIYSSPDGRIFGCPGVLWNRDGQKTQIWIDTELRWEDVRPDFLPAIFVSLGDIQYENAPTLGQEGKLIMNAGGECSYERLCHGSASIVHICNTSGEACSIADNTENYLSSLQDQIASQYCFEHFVVAGRTPLKKKESARSSGKDSMMSVVSVKFDFVDAWVVKYEAPILKSVDMIDRDEGSVSVCGSVVKTSRGETEIEFGDMSSELNTPVDT